MPCGLSQLYNTVKVKQNLTEGASMNRRDFLRSSGAVSASLAIPEAGFSLRKPRSLTAGARSK